MGALLASVTALTVQGVPPLPADDPDVVFDCCSAPVLFWEWGPLRVTDDTVALFVLLMAFVILFWAVREAFLEAHDGD